jgi:hypothetical protein
MLALTTAGAAQGLTTQEKFDALKEAGILDGLSGQGSLDDNITRAEFAKVIQRVLGLDQGADAAATSPSFSDVPDSAGDFLAAYGDLLGPAFVQGVDFRTDRNVTPEELAWIVGQVLEPGAGDPTRAYVDQILGGAAAGFFGGPAGGAIGAGGAAQLTDENRRSLAAAMLNVLGGDRAVFAAAFPDLVAYLPSGSAEDQAATLDYSQFATLLTAYGLDPEVLGDASEEEAINQLVRRVAGRIQTQIEGVDARMRQIMELAEARRREQAAQGSQGGTEPSTSTDPSEPSLEALRQQLAERQEQQRQLREEQRQREHDEAMSRLRDQMAAQQAEKQQSKPMPSIWPAWVAADSRYAPLFEPRTTELSTFRASYSGEARASDGNGNSIAGAFHATLDSGSVSTIYHGQIFGLNFTTDPITSSGDFIANLSSGTSVVTSGTSAQYSGGGLNGYFYGQGATGVGGTFELRGVSTDNMYGDFVGVVP